MMGTSSGSIYPAHAFSEIDGTSHISAVPASGARLRHEQSPATGPFYLEEFCRDRTGRYTVTFSRPGMADVTMEIDLVEGKLAITPREAFMIRQPPEEAIIDACDADHLIFGGYSFMGVQDYDKVAFSDLPDGLTCLNDLVDALFDLHEAKVSGIGSSANGACGPASRAFDHVRFDEFLPLDDHINGSVVGPGPEPGNFLEHASLRPLNPMKEARGRQGVDSLPQRPSQSERS